MLNMLLVSVFMCYIFFNSEESLCCKTLQFHVLIFSLFLVYHSLTWVSMPWWLPSSNAIIKTLYSGKWWVLICVIHFFTFKIHFITIKNHFIFLSEHLLKHHGWHHVLMPQWWLLNYLVIISCRVGQCHWYICVILVLTLKIHFATSKRISILSFSSIFGAT